MAGSSRGDPWSVLEQLRNGGSRFHLLELIKQGRAVPLRGLCLSSTHTGNTMFSRPCLPTLSYCPYGMSTGTIGGHTDRVIVPGFWRLPPVEKGRP